MKTIKLEDLAPEVKEKILDTLHATKEWRNLQNKVDKAKLKYDLITVSNTLRLMRQIEYNSVKNYVESIKEENVTISELMKDVSEEDRDYFMEKLYGIVLICDVIDGYIMDADATIKKHCPDCELVFYNTLKALGKEVRMQINQIIGKSTQENDDFFCKYSDRIISYAEKQINVHYRQQKRLKAKEERSKQRHDKAAKKAPL